MNPAKGVQAFEISASRVSLFTLKTLGSLHYSSAYKPFYSSTGSLLGYINLQHFGQQREFENQIQDFLVAIVNVFHTPFSYFHSARHFHLKLASPHLYEFYKVALRELNLESTMNRYYMIKMMRLGSWLRIIIKN